MYYKFLIITKAFFSGRSNWIDYIIVPKVIEIKNNPQRNIMNVRKRPKFVFGNKSPYPTVVIVTQTNHIECKNTPVGLALPAVPLERRPDYRRQTGVPNRALRAMEVTLPGLGLGRTSQPVRVPRRAIGCWRRTEQSPAPGDRGELR